MSKGVQTFDRYCISIRHSVYSTDRNKHFLDFKKLRKQDVTWRVAPITLLTMQDWQQIHFFHTWYGPHYSSVHPQTTIINRTRLVLRTVPRLINSFHTSPDLLNSWGEWPWFWKNPKCENDLHLRPIAFQVANIVFNFSHYSSVEDTVMDRVWRDILKRLGVTVNLNSGFLPQANGQLQLQTRISGVFYRLTATTAKMSGLTSYPGLNMIKIIIFLPTPVVSAAVVPLKLHTDSSS